MRNLLNFFIKYFSWLVFIFYVIISCGLLFKSNPYQQHVYLTSANSMCSAVYGILNNITSYFHLHDINEDLHNRNAMLEMEVINLRNEVSNLKLMVNDTTEVPSALHNYDFILAHVISNSISQPENYITINRGSEDGIVPEMGVIDQNGVVGIVNVVGPHSARVISLLNPNFRLSCKVKGHDFFGSLVWDGKDPHHAVLEEMPKHVKFVKGDTIITSGYSSVFPEGIIVGTIQEQVKDKNDNFLSLRINLSTDFTQLSTVRTIKNNMHDEIKQLNDAENEGKEVKND